MSKLTVVLQGKPGFRCLDGVSLHQIEQAKASLSVVFAPDYREMVTHFGIAVFEGHELTGLCPFPRLNVVNVTQEERSRNPSVPPGLYVIEQANIDGIVLWQSANGEVYQSHPNAPLFKMADSLLGYLEIESTGDS